MRDSFDVAGENREESLAPDLILKDEGDFITILARTLEGRDVLIMDRRTDTRSNHTTVDRPTAQALAIEWRSEGLIVMEE